MADNSRAARILTWLLGEAEEINGRHRCPTYLYRWRIWGGSVRHGHPTGRAIYIHHFVGDDWSLNLHDHPKRFISVGLWGAYLETSAELGRGASSAIRIRQRRYRAPWIRTFPAEHIHRIETPSRNCWTLVITLKAVR